MGIENDFLEFQKTKNSGLDSNIESDFLSFQQLQNKPSTMTALHQVDKQEQPRFQYTGGESVEGDGTYLPFGQKGVPESEDGIFMKSLKYGMGRLLSDDDKALVMSGKPAYISDEEWLSKTPEWRKNMHEYGEKLKRENEVKTEPWTADWALQGIGQMAPEMVGLAAASAAALRGAPSATQARTAAYHTALRGGAGEKLATAAGEIAASGAIAPAQAIPEAEIEANDAYNEALKDGKSQQEAERIRDYVRKFNLAALSSSDAAQNVTALGKIPYVPKGVAGKLAAKAGRLGLTMAFEGAEEGAQETAAPLATGEAIDAERVKQAAALGALGGGVFHVAGRGINKAAEMASENQLSRQNEQIQQPQPSRAATVDHIISAISGQESGSNSNAVNPDSGAYGEFQIMPENWPSWSQEAGLSPNAERTPENQRLVARYKFQQYLNDFGSPELVAAAWYAGPGYAQSLKDSKPLYDPNTRFDAEGNLDPNGKYPSVNEYIQQVMGRMGKDFAGVAGGPQSSAKAIQEDRQPAFTEIKIDDPTDEQVNEWKAKIEESRDTGGAEEINKADEALAKGKAGIADYAQEQGWQDQQKQKEAPITGTQEAPLSTNQGQKELSKLLAGNEAQQFNANGYMGAASKGESQTVFNRIPTDKLWDLAIKYDVPEQREIQAKILAELERREQLPTVDQARNVVSNARAALGSESATVPPSFVDSAKREQLQGLANAANAIAAQKFDQAESALTPLPSRTEPAKTSTLTSSPEVQQRIRDLAGEQPAEIITPSVNQAGIQAVQQLKDQMNPRTVPLTTAEIANKGRQLTAAVGREDYVTAIQLAKELNLPKRVALYENALAAQKGDFFGNAKFSQGKEGLKQTEATPEQIRAKLNENIRRLTGRDFNDLTPEQIQAIDNYCKRAYDNRNMKGRFEDQFLFEREVVVNGGIERATERLNSIIRSRNARTGEEYSLLTDGDGRRGIDSTVKEQSAVKNENRSEREVVKHGGIRQAFRELNARRNQPNNEGDVLHGNGNDVGRIGNETQSGGNTQRDDTSPGGIKYSAGKNTPPDSVIEEQLRIRFIPREKWNNDEQAISELGQQMGAPVRFFVGPRNGRGFHADGVTYINRNGNRGIEWAFWHEQLHWLKQADQNLYGDLVKSIQDAGVVSSEQIAQYRKTILNGETRTDTGEYSMSDSDIIEEMIGDEMADAVSRRKLLRDLAASDQTLFERFVEFIKETVAKMKQVIAEGQRASRLTDVQVQAFERQLRNTLLSLRNLDGKRLFMDVKEFELSAYSGREAASRYSSDEGNVDSNNRFSYSRPIKQDVIPNFAGKSDVEIKIIGLQQVMKLLSSEIKALDKTRVYFEPGDNENLDEYAQHLMGGDKSTNIVPDRVRALFLVEETVKTPDAIVDQPNGRRLYMSFYEDDVKQLLHGIAVEIESNGRGRTVTAFTAKERKRDKRTAIRYFLNRTKEGEVRYVSPEIIKAGLTEYPRPAADQQASASDTELHLSGKNSISENQENINTDQTGKNRSGSISGEKIKYSQGESDTQSFIRKALKEKNLQQTLFLRPVNTGEIKRIQEKTGINTTGYSHYLSSNDLRHILNQHGEGAEKQGDQIPIIERDLEKIPDILMSPQDITKGNPTQREGLPTIRYIKPDVDGTYVVVEVIRERGKKLVVKTMWKKFTTRHHDSNADLLHTSKTGDGLTSSKEPVGFQSRGLQLPKEGTAQHDFFDNSITNSERKVNLPTVLPKEESNDKTLSNEKSRALIQSEGLQLPKEWNQQHDSLKGGLSGHPRPPADQQVSTSDAELHPSGNSSISENQENINAKDSRYLPSLPERWNKSEKDTMQYNADDSVLDKPPVKVTVIRGDEIPLSGDFKQARKEVQIWAKQNIRGNYLNDDTRWNINVAGRSIEHTAGNAVNFEQLQSIYALPNLLKSAVRIDSRANLPYNPDIKGVHTFYAPLRMGDRNYVAKLVVKDVLTKEGRINRFYDHQASRIEPDVVIGEPRENSLGIAPPSGSYTMNISDLLRYVKEEHKPPSLRNNDKGKERSDSLSDIKYSAGNPENGLKSLLKNLGLKINSNVTVIGKQREGVNPVRLLLQSPSRLAEKYPKIRAFIGIGIKAQEQIETLRNNADHSLDKIDKLLKNEDDCNEFQEIMLMGDANGEEYSNQELQREGYSTRTIKAYRMARSLIEKYYNIANDVHQQVTTVSRNLTQSELDDLRNNQFAQIIKETPAAGGDTLVTWKEPKTRVIQDEPMTADQLTEMATNPNVQILRVRNSSGAILNNFTTLVHKGDVVEVSYREQTPPINKRVGYMRHFFSDWMVYEKTNDENGDEKLVSVASANSMKEAVSKANKMDSSKEYVIRPKVFEMPDSNQNAAVIGDREYFRVIKKLEDELQISKSEAQQILDGKVKMKSRGRFLGSKLQRTGAQGYDRDVMRVLKRQMHEISRYAAMDPWKRESISRFERVYGRWDSPNHSLEAQYVQKYIRDVNGDVTDVEKAMDEIINSLPFLPRILDTHGLNRPTVAAMGTAMKYVGIAKLGMPNFKSALVNMAQAINVAGVMNDWGAMADGLYRASRLSLSDKKVLLRSGVASDIGAFDTGAGYSKSERYQNAITRLPLAAFGYTETKVRQAAILGAYHKALKEGKSADEAMVYAKQVNQKANGNYSIADTPLFIRAGGPVTQAMFQFKKYPLKQLELIGELLSGKDAMQNMKYWLPTLAISGAWGTPGFAAIVGPALALILKSMFGADGDDWEMILKNATFKAAKDNPALMAGVKAVWYGIGSLAGVDITKSTGIGDFGSVNNMPKTGWEAFFKVLGGPAGGTIYDSVIKAADADWIGMACAVSPGLGGAIAAISGEKVGARDRVKTKYDEVYERILKATGFRTIDEAIESDKVRIEKDIMKDHRQDTQAAIDKYLKAKESGDNGKIAVATAELRRLRISPKQVDEERRRKGQTDLERTEKTIPRKYRQEIESIRKLQ